ncbi:DUF2235 domain-containing protein [Bradyrhizobium sp. JYMT SZCCT0428]|uniref:DUF2235 domain-containing protein n=1 Tax=Bradyrhizobium sp. JYMT SZCCT0428 TaxID=2807673 RepID=UPI001BA71CEA|nr:DUF2235 domain-containing protein [Bradyrhizobium sp. JYMT SZCCT0428]MBR1149576.1 DUF2235 domain-containing protein [Bradyrhizobium sp. JYMT SZCCT0428]
MVKRIVLLSDGTGNAAGKVWRTNVWRTFQSLELKASDQIAIYDDGVGTSAFKPLAILGGVFGWGLKRNVLNLYKFLCRNYESGDKIYAFGFSRGAFTIRIVIGLVLNQGLVKFANEGELDQKARAAFRAYRHDKYPAWNLQYPFRLAQFLLDQRFYTSCERMVDTIEFVGVWDTVAAYGLPIDEMTRGVNDWLWPLEMPNKDFNTKILKARHALAIDDERATFHPVLWNEDGSNTVSSGIVRTTRDEQLLQVWFTGVHSNVGGGYPDDSLANISLAWMMAEARGARCTSEHRLGKGQGWPTLQLPQRPGRLLPVQSPEDSGILRRNAGHPGRGRQTAPKTCSQDPRGGVRPNKTWRSFLRAYRLSGRIRGGALERSSHQLLAFRADDLEPSNLH